MLEYLKLTNVGPAPEMEMELAPRLNIITGDNGLGKSFLLDVAWWALTRTWARGLVVPGLPPAQAKIEYRYTKATPAPFSYPSTFDRKTETWSVKQSRPPIPGLILYAQVDGGFSVWDPARNYWKKGSPERPPSYLFSAREVWEGNALCEGLVRDWASWQREGHTAYDQLRSVLRALSPSASEPLQPGELRKVFLDDPKKYPTLKMPYGEEVPVIHSSAGMRRVLALSYLLVWAWDAHVESSRLLGQEPAKEVIFLFDEIESHLHPQWQRRIAPALLNVFDRLTGKNNSKVQLIAATHSPLVMTSLEPHFEPERDRVFQLKLRDGAVQLEAEHWAKQGDVVNWLVSETFGLEQARSVEAERAIEAAEAWMRGEMGALPDGLTSKKGIHAELLRLLPGHDPFWPRWIVTADPDGVLP